MYDKRDIILGQVKFILPILKETIYTAIDQLHAEAYLTKEPVVFSARATGEARTIKVGDTWGSLFDCAWFHITGRIPDSALEKHTVLLLDLNGEGCIYDGDGCPIRGITNVTSEYARELGLPGKRVVPILPGMCSEGRIDFWIDAGCNDLFGNFQGEGKVERLDLAVCNDSARDLYYDMCVLQDLLGCIDNETPRYYSVLYALQKAVSLLGDCTDKEAYAAAREVLHRELSKQGGTPSLMFHAVGHAHIDLAWLWPLRETRRKAARTFSTVLELMDRYPDYIFGASQPQLFDWVKQDNPLLFQKIEQKIKEGRFEVQGGMWVEPDTNVPSGESLVRQFLYGKRYFREQFHVDVKNLWLPDAFGYTAALPQIIKKSGCDFFMTIKLSWNTLNQFPYHTFRWEGLDGSEILAHMPPEGTYNSAALPHSIQYAQKMYREKGVCDRALCLFGIGDGGGGPGPEHLERLKRIKNLDGIPPVQQTFAREFFDEIQKTADTLPSWKGELYLEKHQGTLTSQARNKKMNRLAENSLHTTELLLSQAHLQNGLAYPREKLEKIWKEVLLYQFHDILPGSSIKRVYDESQARYVLLLSEIEALRKTALDSLCSNNRKSVYNPLPWEREETVPSGDSYVKVSVPAFGFAPIDAGEKAEYSLASDVYVLENELIRIRFDEDGFISSVYDKEQGKEYVEAGKTANELVLYTDVGDAWDFQNNYRSFPKSRFVLKEVAFSSDCYRAVRTSVYQHGDSTIRQDVVLQGGKKLVDFRTHVEWHEKNKMLRAEFPLNVFSDAVHCDIQFGHIDRSTRNDSSVEKAQYEIAAHKWIDLSEADHGASLLSDCKYGYYAKGNVLSIDLLRSQNYPGEGADLGEQDFSYALYSHAGNVFQCDIEKIAYEYNYPILWTDGFAEVSDIARPSSDHVMIETVKMGEDEDDIVVRLYENKGQAVECGLQLDSSLTRCTLTNLIEDVVKEIPVINGHVTLKFQPFEIHTLRLRR